MVIAVYYHGCSVFPRRLSVVESGSFFFAIRSDLISIGLFIGILFFWPLSVGIDSRPDMQHYCKGSRQCNAMPSRLDTGYGKYNIRHAVQVIVVYL